MKITREILKKMIAEEVAKIDPQNEGFMDDIGSAVKGMGKQAGAALGMDTDPESQEFLNKIYVVIKRLDPRNFKHVDSAIFSGDRDDNKALLQAERVYFVDVEDAKEKLSRARQGLQMLEAWKDSPSGRQADHGADGPYSPNSKINNQLIAAKQYFDDVDFSAQQYISQVKRGVKPERQLYLGSKGSQNESYLSTSLNNLKRVVAEEIVKMELENKGK